MHEIDIQKIFVSNTLSKNTEDMMFADRDISHGICKYMYTPDPFDSKAKSKRSIRETLNYIRAYYKSEYLGIAHKSDPRFNKYGQYIED